MQDDGEKKKRFQVPPVPPELSLKHPRQPLHHFFRSCVCICMRMRPTPSSLPQAGRPRELCWAAFVDVKLLMSREVAACVACYANVMMIMSAPVPSFHACTTRTAEVQCPRSLTQVQAPAQLLTALVRDLRCARTESRRTIVLALGSSSGSFLISETPHADQKRKGQRTPPQFQSNSAQLCHYCSIYYSMSWGTSSSNCPM